MSPHDWCEQVGVGEFDNDAYYRVIEKKIIGQRNQFTLAAVEKGTGNLAGYVHCVREEESPTLLTIGCVKVDWEHQGRGLGKLLIAAGEASAAERGWTFADTSLTVLKRNCRARRCYCSRGFEEVPSHGAWPNMQSRRLQ
ncbi:unnamed protein product [Symbiodinium natans]|uniref:N-acetyltransferase domain-containing protein n=1 Tax=Symbiodinium natans TaxID=878477 RepID=A0A812UZV0_9DINO|nr:unnamed protein product [Symbiodinium natans]